MRDFCGAAGEQCCVLLRIEATQPEVSWCPYKTYPLREPICFLFLGFDFRLYNKTATRRFSQDSQRCQHTWHPPAPRSWTAVLQTDRQSAPCPAGLQPSSPTEPRFPAGRGFQPSLKSC